MRAGEGSGAVTLGEGRTPLVRAERIGAALGLRELWLKLEGGNPTGSRRICHSIFQRVIRSPLLPLVSQSRYL